jgi:ubiquinone biosynthesis monooxygenase Coq7
MASPSADPELANRILKVNHAGEHGAVNIYAGQILMARLLAPGMVSGSTEAVIWLGMRL